VIQNKFFGGKMKKWHRIGLVASGILVIISWAVAIYYWDKLPAIIPTHFGISGQPDDWNPKSAWYSFLMPGLQTLMFIIFSLLYKWPQYSDIPTTMLLMAMDEKKRDHAFALIRTMLVGVLVWVELLLGYMTYAMNISALEENSGLSPWIMGGLLIGMFAWLIWWTIKVYKLTRKLLEENGHKFAK